jgi:DNA-damage-inducible protein J
MTTKSKTPSVNVQFRVKAELKKRAELVLEEFDLTMSEAFKLFLNDVARTRKIPVDLTLAPISSDASLIARQAFERIKSRSNIQGDKWLSLHGLRRENMSEDELYNLIKNA